MSPGILTGLVQDGLFEFTSIRTKVNLHINSPAVSETPLGAGDSSVPLATIRTLKESGAEVVDMSREERLNLVDGRFWRFLAADEEDLDVFVSRDVDSRCARSCPAPDALCILSFLLAVGSPCGSDVQLTNGSQATKRFIACEITRWYESLKLISE